jgi:hypothetical protein
MGQPNLWSAVAALLGIVMTTFWTQRATAERDRRALAHERWAKMVDLQIKTLMEAQDAMVELARAASKEINNLKVGIRPEHGDVSFDFGQASINVTKIMVRIREDSVRESVKEFHYRTSERIMSALSDEPTDKIRYFLAMSEAHVNAHEKIGKLLRQYCEL